MNATKLLEARTHLNEALKALEITHATWSEAVTSLHLAEVNLRAAQKKTRQSYNAVLDALNDEVAPQPNERLENL